MIYRKWSLLSSTIVIWGGAATVGLAGFFLFGGKEKFQDYLIREGERLRQQDRAMMAKTSKA
ncbi:succinate dehydrogenase subunit 8A, mitochondrial-like [Ananas comosus]|uniref:Succinate dehydrogenase subunit 8A, mitochondrial-like n=1 Tax=Ananas comosus TaxID=4615 RepID=A0A199VKW6_ANACO|nr:succinate dehydrogenase subunit 8A, mitochondrial-like [Ananas comosus]OAY77385.1 Succinate dehydrogenase subunit 8A, mitochondrila [Ananas comosus]